MVTATHSRFGVVCKMPEVEMTHTLCVESIQVYFGVVFCMIAKYVVGLTIMAYVLKIRTDKDSRDKYCKKYW